MPDMVLNQLWASLRGPPVPATALMIHAAAHIPTKADTPPMIDILYLVIESKSLFSVDLA